MLTVSAGIEYMPAGKAMAIDKNSTNDINCLILIIYLS